MRRSYPLTTDPVAMGSHNSVVVVFELEGNNAKKKKNKKNKKNRETRHHWFDWPLFETAATTSSTIERAVLQGWCKHQRLDRPNRTKDQANNWPRTKYHAHELTRPANRTHQHPLLKGTLPILRSTKHQAWATSVERPNPGPLYKPRKEVQTLPEEPKPVAMF